MTGLIPSFITGYSAGLTKNKKPFLLPDRAWQKLENAFCYRERILKRQGNGFLGRFTRTLIDQSLGTTPAGPPDTVTFSNIFTTLGITEATAELMAGTLVITVGAPDTATFTDNGDGTFTVTGAGVAAGSYIVYATGEVVLKFSVLTGGAAITADLSYYPGLPVMGINTRDIQSLNDTQTIWFDTKYAYVWTGSGFAEFIPGTIWAGTNSDFFWSINYRGATPNASLFFVTNFVNDAADPMRYTDGITWTTFVPLITATNTLYQARILIPYFGRLLALNVWEGTTMGGTASAVNIGQRCRFSALGNPIDQTNSWRTDIFGQGGVIDAPTSEVITGATFVKNTLIVDFQTETWQLRYVGEYGLPFVWERVSSDFGSSSTFSGVLFDNHRLVVGDTAITAANSARVDRIDLDIPDQVFQFKTSTNGEKRIWGIRDFQREVVFWNWADTQTEAAPGTPVTFPNKVMLYNYRNNTWAIFRDNITAFGTFQNTTDTTWDSTTVTWDDTAITWDDFDDSALFPQIVIGNQQGFVLTYGYVTPDEESLTITGIDLTTVPIQLTVVNHNLQPDEIVYLQNAQFISASTFVPVTTSLNDVIYAVSIIDPNTLGLFLWNTTTQNYGDDFSFTPDPSNYIYVGGGTLALFPKLDIISKDINLFQSQGLQTKLSRLDFLMESSVSSAMTIELNLNTGTTVSGNMLVNTKNMSTTANPPFYTPGDDYSWFRYYATLAAQYFNIEITYNDDLMNQLSTHQQVWTLYAINAMVRKGGKNVF